MVTSGIAHDGSDYADGVLGGNNEGLGWAAADRNVAATNEKDGGLGGRLAQDARSIEQISALKEEELELANTLFDEFPNTEYALVLMGNVLRRRGNTVAAVEFWTKAIERNPQRTDLHCALGRIALDKGDYDRAVEQYRKAMRIDPAVSGGFLGIARALTALGKQDEAVEELNKGLAIMPGHAFAHEFLGGLYLQREDYDKARQHYEAAAGLQPNSANAYYGLLSVYSILKQPAKARENMAIFKRLKAQEMKALKDENEAYDDILMTRAVVAGTYAYAGAFYRARGNLPRAHELLARGLAIDPNDLTCLDNMAQLHISAGRLPDALTTYTRISEIAPDHSACHLSIGIVSSSLNRPKDAEKAFLKVISLAPQSPEAYRELARLYLKTTTNTAQACELALKAVTLGKKAEDYFVLAWALDKNGDSPGALAAMEKALELEPNNDRYKRAYEHINKTR